jgi:hypothetical protein
MLTLAGAIALGASNIARASNADQFEQGSGTIVQSPGVVLGNQFVAHSGPGGPLGAVARGHLTVKYNGLPDFQGDVTCLNVVGNRALAGVVVTKSADPSLPPGTFIWQLAEDNSTNGQGHAANKFDFTGPRPGPTNVCPPPPPPTFVFDGPIHVRG